MLYTWGRPLVWPEVQRETAIDGLQLDGCTMTIAVNAVQEYFVPIRYGDQLTMTNKLASVSDEKTTRLGTGHFVTTVETLRNQHGQVVGTHTFTLFTYRPAGDAMIVTGHVAKKYVTDGEHRVDLEIMISTQEGPATPCSATLALPSRSE